MKKITHNQNVIVPRRKYTSTKISFHYFFNLFYWKIQVDSLHICELSFEMRLNKWIEVKGHHFDEMRGLVEIKHSDREEFFSYSKFTKWIDSWRLMLNIYNRSIVRNSGSYLICGRKILVWWGTLYVEKKKTKRIFYFYLFKIDFTLFYLWNELAIRGTFKSASVEVMRKIFIEI